MHEIPPGDRCTTTLIARVSNRTVNELAGVSRVVYDVTNNRRA